jgi:hypothetical protein
MDDVIKDKLRRGLALTVKESWDLYQYIKTLDNELKAYREAYEKIKKLPIRYNEVQGITRCLNIIEDCLGEDETDEASDNDK